jgi:hypothetical protein
MKNACSKFDPLGLLQSVCMGSLVVCLEFVWIEKEREKTFACSQEIKSEASATLKLWRFSNKLISALFFSHKNLKFKAVFWTINSLNYGPIFCELGVHKVQMFGHCCNWWRNAKQVPVLIWYESNWVTKLWFGNSVQLGTKLWHQTMVCELHTVCHKIFYFHISWSIAKFG